MSRMPSREEAVFADALAQPESRRAAFLNGVCSEDPALRARVEDLLAAYSGMDAIEPLIPRPFAPFHEEKSGSVIGRYKLLQKIGEGGCGVVWMAEQEEPVRRRVALKVIKLGMDTREVIARFSAERQALAMMDHPGIAKVFDAGSTDAGRPFFVMELVRGVRITTYCDDQKLDLAGRLQLFIQVCHAVQHAHQKGIIHRDLKPSNVLVSIVEKTAVPKVIDFGIAKATQGRLTDATLFTAYDQIIGTPAYMSPEQADTGGIDIDTRSDVYSLGVLLYELLTGRCPFDPDSLGTPNREEMRRVIREVEPPRPSTRFSTLIRADRDVIAGRRCTDSARLPLLLSGDLDWIVMKALEKSRARRYDTPTALAEDIGRHLNNEVVMARPQGGWYRCRRFVRRNRLVVGAVTTIALTMVAGTAISIGQAVRARRAERTAKVAESRAVDERTRAIDLLTFMVDELKAPLNRIGELAVIDRVLEKAMQHFTSRGPHDLDDDSLVNYVIVQYRLGLLRMDQARYVEAEAAFRDAHALAVSVVTRMPRNARALSARGDAEWGNGFFRYQRGDVEEAREWFRRERETRAAVVLLEPNHPQWQLDLAKQQGNFAAIEKEHGDPELARATFRAQLGTLQKLLAAKPGDLEPQKSIANTTSFLGLLAEDAGDFKEAAERFAQQTAQLEAIARAEPKDPHWKHKQGESLSFHAAVCTITGRRVEASQHLARARAARAAGRKGRHQSAPAQSNPHDRPEAGAARICRGRQATCSGARTESPPAIGIDGGERAHRHLDAVQAGHGIARGGGTAACDGRTGRRRHRDSRRRL